MCWRSGSSSASARTGSRRGDARLPRTSFVAIAFLVVFLARLSRRLLQHRHGHGGRAVREGDDEVHDPLPVPDRRRRVPRALRADVLLAGVRRLHRRDGRSTPPTASSSCSRRGRDGDIDKALLSPITGGASSINIYGAIEGANIYRPNALTGDPNHLGVMLVIPLIALTARLSPSRARPPLEGAARDHARVPAPRRADDALAQRPARADRRPARAPAPLPPAVLHARVPRAARVGRRPARDRHPVAARLLRARDLVTRADRRRMRPRRTSTSTASCPTSCGRTRCSASG